MIAKDLRLVASPLYIKLVLSGPGYITCSRAVTLSPSLCVDPLGCINPYKSRKETTKQLFNVHKCTIP